MADYGVTPAGYVAKTFDQILADIKTWLQDSLGNVNVDDDAILGILAGIDAKPVTDLWDVSAGVYYSAFPNYASGAALDDVCELNAIRRLDERPSIATVSCSGVEGTDIPVGSIFTTQLPVFNYVTQLPITISIDNTNYFTVEVTTVIADTDYIITSNNRNAVINSGTGADKESIAIALFNEVNNLTSVLGINAEIKDSENGILDLWSNDKKTAVQASVSAELTVTDFWSPVRCNSQEVGSQVVAVAGKINQILIPIAGLTEVYNHTDAMPGRDKENDVALRDRRYESVRITGGGTVSAVVARVRQNVPLVTQVRGYENDSIVTDLEGRPPKCIEIYVVGGDDTEIAQEIRVAKADGIQAYGNIIVVVEDSEGTEYSIGFSRPVDVYIWVKITLTTTPDYPINGDTLISENILAYALDYKIGDEVLIQALYCPIYHVDGVETAIIELAKTYTTSPPGAYVTTNIEIDEDEIALFDSTRIEIITP